MGSIEILVSCRVAVAAGKQIYEFDPFSSLTLHIRRCDVVKDTNQISRELIYLYKCTTSSQLVIYKSWTLNRGIIRVFFRMLQVKMCYMVANIIYIVRLLNGMFYWMFYWTAKEKLSLTNLLDHFNVINKCCISICSQYWCERDSTSIMYMFISYLHKICSVRERTIYHDL